MAFLKQPGWYMVYQWYFINSYVVWVYFKRFKRFQTLYSELTHEKFFFLVEGGKIVI